jgi:Molybdopterin converting factor, large subunit
LTSNRYAQDVLVEKTADDWFAITDEPLSVGELYDWAVRPACGAVVVFSGTVRDHAVEGDQLRTGVEFLEYEAYAEEVIPRFRSIAVKRVNVGTRSAALLWCIESDVLNWASRR